MAFVTLSGGKVFYLEHPDRRRDPDGLVLIHGGGANHRFWHHQYRSLSSRYRTIVFDLPEHGRSEGTARDDVGSYARLALELSQRLGLARTVACGHSMGGAVALQWALDYPGTLSGLVLVATGARLKVHPRTLQLLATGQHDLEFVNLACGNEIPAARLEAGRADWLSTPPGVFYADFCGCNAFEVTARLHEIHLPTLIICGAEDRITPPKYAQFLHDHISASKLVVIPGAGHMVLLEQPDAVSEAIVRFFQSDLREFGNHKEGEP